MILELNPLINLSMSVKRNFLYIQVGSLEYLRLL